MTGPRRLVHRGRVLAAGRLVHRDDESRARATVLGTWQVGDTVLEAPDVYVVRFASPRRLPAAEGALLGGRPLLAAPLQPDEVGEHVEADLLFVRGDTLEPRTLQPAMLGTWFAVDGFVQGRPLPPPPAPPREVPVLGVSREDLGAP
ncbi:MAG: hypothetical protein H6736_25260, partial [Alphaproteobacteria bacterium]|nr:hypothetical protein [Alphaproteobacteria bacterium]